MSEIAADAAPLLAAHAPVLAQNVLLAGLDPAGLRAFARYLDGREVPAGDPVIDETSAGGELFFIVEGEARLRRGRLDLGTLGPGASFGEMSLLARRQRGATVVAVTRLVLLRLTRARYDALAAVDPALALGFTQALVGSLGARFAQMAESVGLLLRERSLPRRVAVEVAVRGEKQRARMGTPLRSLLPAAVEGSPVVAALVGNRAVALDTPLTSETAVEALAADHWEGKRVYRQSLGLLLLEAASYVDPEGGVRLGPSIGYARWVTRSGATPIDPAAWAERVARRMHLLIAIDAAFRHELWSVDEARHHFAERGARDAVLFLRGSRDGAVPLSSCGNVYALGTGPLLPTTGPIGDFPFRVEPVDHDGAPPRNPLEAARRFLLHYGDEPADTPSEMAGPLAPMRAADGADELWLGALGVTSVGAFNEACVVGNVSQIIRVGEGLHEKRLGQIADTIAARVGPGGGHARAPGRVRIVAIAGPSSSGKTTFIKRLTVQLQVDGIHPVALSLDDYYVDRERTPLDAQGERDYESLEALDLPVLHDHLRRILAGEEVRTARFDFARGKSDAQGGPTLALPPAGVLLLEGIHGLNPRLLEAASGGEDVFRIFLQPTTTLPIDALTYVHASDLRLLRRLVRDRRQRGTGPAENILRWPRVRAGERKHIFPFLDRADVVFDSALVYEPSVIKVFADRYLLEVPEDHPAFVTAHRLRRLIDAFVTIYPDHVPPTSILREFIGESGFEY